ncbi:quinone-dependent dihydroorotate dehydrogenase [SAR86 cluster bacterium]|nr:quinone-dependent dihydroorotate dehydrogenase [SAR86 cluster bacterium]
MLKSILLSFLSIFLFILKRFPPEPSKKFSLKLLKLSWKYFSFLPIFNSNKSKVIEKKIILNGLSFKNNVGIAAGLDKEGKYFSALGSLGFGFVEVGTFTPKAQEGNTKPRIKRLKNDSIINRLGFNNPGIDEGIKNIKRNINNFNGVLGISIGKNKNTELKNAYKDYIFCMNRSYEVADYLALNISSPNTEGLRDLASEEFIEKLIREVTFEKRRLKEKFIKNVPIYIKISPDESDKNLFHLINLSEDYGIDGFIVSNTYVGEAKGISGGISGSMLKEKSLHMLKKVNSLKRKNSTLISSGGISSKSDIKERMENGADLIQIYTSFVYRGPAILEELVN